MRSALFKIVAVLAIVAVFSVAAFLVSSVTNTNIVTAQSDSRTIPLLTLDSSQPGQMTINWNAPSEVPVDYRIAWARNDLSFPSWRDDNESHRGNEYPRVGITSLTIRGLTDGDIYKVQMRSRYGRGNGSGPWSDTVTKQVMAEEPDEIVVSTPEPATPTPVPPTPEPTKEPKKEPTPEPDRARNVSTDIILVDNTGLNEGDGFVSISSIRKGQSFTTGPNIGGYTVKKVTVIAEAGSGFPLLDICTTKTVKRPVPNLDDCQDTETPPSFGAGERSFTPRSGQTITLDRDTTYMLVFKREDPNDDPVLLDADSGNEETPATDGWSIRDKYQVDDSDDYPWFEHTSELSIQFRITGHLNPPPPLVSPEILRGYLTPTGDSTQSLFVQWKYSDNSTPGWEYRYRRTSDSNWQAWILFPESDSLTYEILALPDDARYEVEIRAVRDGTFGPATGTTLLRRPSALQTTPGIGLVALEWNSADDSSLTGYEYAKLLASDNTWIQYNLQENWDDLVHWTMVPSSTHSTTFHQVSGLDDEIYQFAVREVRGDYGGYPALASSPPYLPPTVNDLEVRIQQDESYTFSAEDFAFTSNHSDDTLQSVQIMTLPERGRLLLYDSMHDRYTNLIVGNSITIDQLNNNQFWFTPFYGTSAADVADDDYASFTFKVTGALSNKQSIEANTFSIDVTYVGVTGLVAGLGQSSFNLQWIDSEDDSIIRHDVSTDNGTTWIPIVSGDSVTPADFSREVNTLYEFRVRAFLGDNNFGVEDSTTARSMYCVKTIWGGLGVEDEHLCLRVSANDANRIEVVPSLNGLDPVHVVLDSDLEPVPYTQRTSVAKIIAYRDASMERYPSPPDANSPCTSADEECWLESQSVSDSTSLDYNCSIGRGDSDIRAFLVYETRFDRQVFPNPGASNYDTWQNGVKLNLGCN